MENDDDDVDDDKWANAQLRRQPANVVAASVMTWPKPGLSGGWRNGNGGEAA